MKTSVARLHYPHTRSKQCACSPDSFKVDVSIDIGIQVCFPCSVLSRK